MKIVYLYCESGIQMKTYNEIPLHIHYAVQKYFWVGIYIIKTFSGRNSHNINMLNKVVNI